MYWQRLVKVGENVLLQTWRNSWGRTWGRNCFNFVEWCGWNPCFHELVCLSTAIFLLVNASSWEAPFPVCNGNDKAEVLSSQEAVFMHENCSYGFGYFEKCVLQNSPKSFFEDSVEDASEPGTGDPTHRAWHIVWNNWKMELCKTAFCSNVEFALYSLPSSSFV